MAACPHAAAARWDTAPYLVLQQRRGEKLETGTRTESKVRVLRDEVVKPAMPWTAKSYVCDGGVLRCVTAEVEYDGKMLEMSFLTNNMEARRVIRTRAREGDYSPFIPSTIVCLFGPMHLGV